MLLLECIKSYARLGSKRGIALTVGILAAIIGSSFLIWYIPQSSPGTFELPRTDEVIISDVYSLTFELANDVDSKFERWKQSQLPTEDMLARITAAGTETTSMKAELDQAKPAQEWQESYDLYVQALDSFQKFLNVMEARVEEDDKGDDPELESLRVEWNNHVDNSVNAMPINN
jgi:hypothetical protein